MSVQPLHVPSVQALQVAFGGYVHDCEAQWVQHADSKEPVAWSSPPAMPFSERSVSMRMAIFLVFFI